MGKNIKLKDIMLMKHIEWSCNKLGYANAHDIPAKSDGRKISVICLPTGRFNHNNSSMVVMSDYKANKG